jgi:hypothetical protein
MYTIHLELLGMIHECRLIAVIASQRLNNIVCMFNFLAGVVTSELNRVRNKNKVMRKNGMNWGAIPK